MLSQFSVWRTQMRTILVVSLYSWNLQSSRGDRQYVDNLKRAIFQIVMEWYEKNYGPPREHNSGGEKGVICCCSVAKLRLTLCDLMDCSIQSFPVLHYLQESAQIHVHSVGDPIHHLVLCCPFLLLPSIFPSIMIFSNKSALHIRWPKYWSFSFSISPSNEYPGLISFRTY